MKKNVEHGRAKDKGKPVRDDPKGCRVCYYSLDMFSKNCAIVFESCYKDILRYLENDYVRFCFSPYQLAHR